MKVVWFDNNDPRPTVDPLMALISIDEDIAYAALAVEGYKAIADFLNEIGYPLEIEVPKQYRRHLNNLINKDYEI